MIGTSNHLGHRLHFHNFHMNLLMWCQWMVVLVYIKVIFFKWKYQGYVLWALFRTNPGITCHCKVNTQTELHTIKDILCKHKRSDMFPLTSAKWGPSNRKRGPYRNAHFFKKMNNSTKAYWWNISVLNKRHNQWWTLFWRKTQMMMTWLKKQMWIMFEVLISMSTNVIVCRLDLLNICWYQHSYYEKHVAATNKHVHFTWSTSICVLMTWRRGPQIMSCCFNLSITSSPNPSCFCAWNPPSIPATITSRNGIRTLQCGHLLTQMNRQPQVQNLSISQPRDRRINGQTHVLTTAGEIHLIWGLRLQRIYSYMNHRQIKWAEKQKSQQAS